MKRKSLLAMSLIVAVVSSSAFSIEIVKGQLLEHKQWSTDHKSQGIFVPTTYDHNKLNALLKKFQNNLEVNIHANVHLNTPEQTIHVDDSINVNGKTNTLITNYTVTDKTYVILQGICDGAVYEWISMCTVDYNKIKLNSGGYLVLSQNPSWELKFSQPSMQRVSVFVQIESAEDNYTVFSAEDEAYIKVDPQAKK